jgi:hypothetical protein
MKLTIPHREIGRRGTRALLALLAGALLAAGAGACGGGSAGTKTAGATPAAHAVHTGGYLKADADNDGDDAGSGYAYSQDDQEFLARYGHRAHPATTRVVASLVKRYYAAKLAGDGESVCVLLDPVIARQISGGADACPKAIAPLLAQQHGYLHSEEPATMTVIGVYVKGTLALAMLGFERSPEANIPLEREGGSWKIDSLTDDWMT